VKRTPGAHSSFHNTVNDLRTTAGSDSFQLGSQPSNLGKRNTGFMTTTTSTTLAVSSGFGGYGGGMGEDSLHAILDAVSSVQDTVNGIYQKFAAQEQALESRQNWLELQINGLDRRCQKVETSVDNLRQTFQGFEFEPLVELPRRISTAIRHANRSAPPGGAVVTLHGEPEVSENPYHDDKHGGHSISDPPRSSSPHAGVGNYAVNDMMRSLDKRIQAFDEKAEELLVQAREWTDIRKLFWKIDVNVRKILTGEQLLPNNNNKKKSQNDAGPDIDHCDSTLSGNSLADNHSKQPTNTLNTPMHTARTAGTLHSARSTALNSSGTMIASSRQGTKPSKVTVAGLR